MFETMESRTMFAASATPTPTPHDAGESADANRPSRPAPIYASVKLDLSPQASRSQFSVATEKLAASPKAELNS